LKAVSTAVSPTESPIAETIEITNPGKPVRPNRADFINPETGKLDREAYRAAMEKYRKELAAYRAALKEYRAAVRAVKFEARGQNRSLQIEERAIKVVNRALSRLVKKGQRADGYVTRAEITLKKAAEYRELAKELRKEAEERAVALLGEGWTKEDLEAKLVRPNRLDFVDPKTGKVDREAYNAAMAEYKEARAIANMFKKADKYELRAEKLEARAELYQEKAVEVTAKAIDRFKSVLEDLVSKYESRAKSLRASGEGLLTRAGGLTGADYYKAVGRGLYEVELAEGYERGAEIATAVLETYMNVDVSVTPEVAASLDSVDISNVNVSI